MCVCVCESCNFVTQWSGASAVEVESKHFVYEKYKKK